MGFKGSLCNLVENHGKVPRRDASPILRSVSVETITETSEVFIFADINGDFPSFSTVADL